MLGVIPFLAQLPPPRNAWLLIGDDASLHTRAQLRKWVREFDKGWCQEWTSSQRVEPGDLLFIYYISPHKAIREVTRALDRPVQQRDANVNALIEVSDVQWMVKIAPPVQVKPVTYAELSAASGEKPLLKGRSGKFFLPSVANALLRQMHVIYEPQEDLRQQIMREVVGRDDLPNPETLDLSEWSAIPSSRLRFEKEVEQFIIEPLIKLCALGKGYRYLQQHPMGGGFTDYVIYFGAKAVCIIEGKQRLQRVEDVALWSDSPDYEQLQRYCRTETCGGALIDSDQIVLFDSSGAFAQRFDRRTMTGEELRIISAHIRGGSITSK